MTQEETLKELRLLEQPLPFWGKRDMEIAKSAADLIESLLSERADKDNHIAALAAELTDKNGQLKFHAEQLLDDVKRIDGLTARAESAEAELGRAIWDIGCLVDKLYLQKNYQCLFCKYYLDLPHKDFPIDGIPQCGRCDKANGFKWYGDKFEWRGARKEGKDG
jgi:hypothetical protein